MIIPASTYRLQFNTGFRFENAERIVPYLDELGISHIYASPIMTARPGSSHGYDVTDPNKLNPELGTEQDFDRLSDLVSKHKMKWLQDFVPNHMAFDGCNHILMDVLESGSYSPYIDFFYIDWNHPYESINGKLLAPFLGKFYGICLENGELQLSYDERGFAINYYQLRFPLRIEIYLDILTHKIYRLKRKLGADDPDYIKFLGTLYVLRSITQLEEDSENGEIHDQIAFFKRMLWELYSSNADIRKFVDNNIILFNGKPDSPESYNLLDQLLSRQWFRLSYWKVGSEEINYKRFFNVNELISIRIEEDSVLDYYHSTVFKLIDEKKIHGLRFDHIDGLWNPALYLRKIKAKTNKLYTVVEKILTADEKLPLNWDTEGTTGYDFLTQVNNLFCRQKSEEDFTKVYNRFIGEDIDFHDLVYQKKLFIVEKHMSGELDHLARDIKRISSRYRYGSDLTFSGLKDAIEEVMAAFPVYRTYITEETYSTRDKQIITSVIAGVKERYSELYYEFQFLEKVLTLDYEDFLSDEEKQEWIDFVQKFQQYIGPLMAKGMEDTVFYIYNRLLSLNEVGGEPTQFGISTERFHEFCANRQKTFPNTLNCSSTHDTKRSEDVRARLNVLSEIPKEWEKNLRVWANLNMHHKRKLNEQLSPNRNAEYMLYQILLGTFPFYLTADDKEGMIDYLQRIKDYVIKAIREAKVFTAWLKPDKEYEDAFLNFIESIFHPPKNNRFLQEFTQFQGKISFFGMFNALSQTLIKMNSPGVPDFYRGTELWDFSLVDPDNRRPVDFHKRRIYLNDIKEKERINPASLIRELLLNPEDGRIKLYLIYKNLSFRRDHPRLFQKGAYIPLETTGKFADHVIAFARRLDKEWVLVLAPRFLTGLIQPRNLPLGTEVWQDTSVVFPADAPKEWADLFTGKKTKRAGMIKVGDWLSDFPVGLLYSGSAHHLLHQ